MVTPVMAMVIMPSDSNIGADACVNTWHFLVNDPIAGYLTNINTALTTFYTAIDDLLSKDIQGTACRIKMYNLDDPVPRPPVWDTPLTLVTDTGSPAPPELSICLSFQAVRVAGAAQARRRGRVFLGPLKVASIDGTGRFNSADLTQIKNAAAAFLGTSNSDSTYSWAVYSRVTHTSSDVNNGWIDNAFDIQRRRGTKPTSKLTF